MLPKYSDPLYQAAHEEAFSKPLDAKIETVLPPDVSQEDFTLALEQITAALGTDAVFTGDGLKDYVDPYEIPEAGHERSVPSAAACPSSVSDIQAVLKIVNKYKIPVWTFSRGKNLGYGGPAPRVPGCIALDLHRMDKIIEVNEKFSFAVVEPGVTFGDLYEYCKKNKLKVWPSTASLGWGSVIGNALDRGLGFIPTGVHHENIVGMEVVLADGDIVRTGQFAMSNSPSAHITKLTFGPTIDGLFLQSNLGIVTRMGVNLTPQPQAYMACSFDAPEFDHIEGIVDVFGELRRNGTLPYMVYVFYIAEWATMFGKHSDWWGGEGPIPDWRLKEMQEDLDVGIWTVKFGLYGPTNIIKAQFEEVERFITKKGLVGRLRQTLFTGENEESLLEAAAVSPLYGGVRVGIPSMWNIPMVNYYNRRDDSVGAHGAYSPIVPLDGKTVLEWARTAKGICAEHGFDFLCDFFMHDRYAIFVTMLCFDKTSPEQRIGVDEVFRNLFKEGSKRGFAKYRAHINHMDLNAELFDFNNHAYRRFVEKLKESLDPNGILSSGKMGIWPERLKRIRTDS
ncbi:putative vanilly-alcohol oxidase [Daldinia caldariorum]|uniref:putative vanilly-alcohol oxidase n=1 Tax=Daldinia caldariorum TaxID=326644 RepID=UPI0020080EF8|nr:putative vanilly-alcohol oxidase [Daldinia caldariorum]KAI1464416.1 putative vanilly-alcohol oxidase [Daldinia caldariorum]